MKNTDSHYLTYIRTISLVIAFVFAMFSDYAGERIFEWVALCLLWREVLLQLRKPQIYSGLFKDKAFIFYLIFLIWAVISSFFLSVSKSISITMLIPFIGGMLSYFIAFTSSSKQSQLFYQFILSIGLLLVFFTIYQVVILNISRPSGVLGNWNTHAALLAMILLPGLLCFLVRKESELKELIFWCIMCILFAFAMGLTLSRGVLLILFTTFICYGIYVFRAGLFYKKTLLILFSLTVGYALTSLLIDETIFQRIMPVENTKTTDSIALLSSGRHLLWLPAWQMYLDSPFTGWGLAVYYFLYTQYRPPLSTELGHYAHNDFLQILVELGPIGLIIFLAFVYILLKRLAVLLFSSNSSLLISKEPIKMSIFLMATSIGMLVHTFFTFHLYQLTMQIIWGYYLGWAARNINPECTCNSILQKVNSQNFAWIYRGICTVVIIYLLHFGLTYYFLGKAQNSQSKQEILDNYLIASILFPVLDRYEATSAYYMLQQLAMMPVNSETQQQRLQIADRALNLIDTAISKVPLNSANYITKAEIIQLMQGSSSIVIDQYEKALQLNPLQIKARNDFAHYLVLNKHYTKALNVLSQAWGRVHTGSYHTAINFLAYQLKVNSQYGKSGNNVLIEQEIRHLRKKLNEGTEAGVYYFKKEKL